MSLWGDTEAPALINLWIVDRYILHFAAVFLTFLVYLDLYTTNNLCKRESCFGMVLHVFDLLLYRFYIYLTGILLLLAVVFSREIPSARLCI